jgi:hypothetical protein
MKVLKFDGGDGGAVFIVSSYIAAWSVEVYADSGAFTTVYIASGLGSGRAGIMLRGDQSDVLRMAIGGQL